MKAARSTTVTNHVTVTRPKVFTQPKAVSRPQTAIRPKMAKRPKSATFPLHTKMHKTPFQNDQNEMQLFERLFEHFVGTDRSFFLGDLLRKQTYIITLNGSVSTVDGVIQLINPEFKKERIYSERKRYDDIIRKISDCDRTKLSIAIKLTKIDDIIRRNISNGCSMTSIFVDDSFPSKMVYDGIKEMRKTEGDQFCKGLKYLQVSGGYGKGMIEIEYKRIRKYDLIFLDFDGTITKNIDSSHVIGHTCCNYVSFLDLFV